MSAAGIHALMKNIRLSTVVLLIVDTTAQAHAAPRRGDRILMRIEPATRLEQVCDVEAMHRIARIRPFKPDRAKSDVVSHPIHDGDAMKATGGAFRSAGKWYAFSFECRGTPDHKRVLSLSFQIGDAIPKARWADLGLWQ